MVGDKVILHSRGPVVGWLPLEDHTVVKVGPKGIFVDGLENVGFKSNGQEVEPGAVHFRFYIEHAPEKKGRKRGKVQPK